MSCKTISWMRDCNDPADTGFTVSCVSSGPVDGVAVLVHIELPDNKEKELKIPRTVYLACQDAIECHTGSLLNLCPLLDLRVTH